MLKRLLSYSVVALITGILIGILAACSDLDAPPTQTPVVIYIVVTATPGPVTATPVPIPSDTPVPPAPVPPSSTPVPPTETPNAVQTATAVAMQAQAQAATHATETVAAKPTRMPSYGDTSSLDDWTISIPRLRGPISELQWSDVGNTLICNGNCWLVYLDARNMENSTRTLAQGFTFELTDDHGATYPEDQSGPDSYAIGEFVSLQGRNPLDIGTTPRDTAHTLLMFDIATDSVPAVLAIHGSNAGDENHVVMYNLKR